MLSNRQKSILILLINNRDWCKGDDIATSLSISKKLVQQEIKEISNQLKDSCSIISNNRKGYFLEYLSQDMRKQLLASIDRYENSAHMKKRGIIIYIYLLLQDNYLSMEKLADTFFLSKTAIASEIEAIKRRVHRLPNIELIISNRNGIKIECDENERRIEMAKYSSILTIKALPISNEMKQEYEKIAKNTKNIMKNIMIKYYPLIVGDDYFRVLRYCAIIIFRSLHNHPIKNSKITYKETPLIKKISSAFQTEFNYILTTNEKYELNKFINECSIIQLQNFEDNTVEQIVNTFEKILIEELHLPSNMILFNNKHFLIDHIKQMKIRISQGHNVVNYYSSDIIIRYPLETYFIDHHLSNLLNMKIVKPELSFLILYLASSLEQIKHKIKILLISNKSLSILNYIQDYLYSHFNGQLVEIVIEPEYYFSTHPEITNSFDLLLTTEQEVVIKYLSFQLIPVLSNQEIMEHLSKTIQKSLESKENETTTSLQTKHIIEKHIVQKRIQSLNELINISSYPGISINNVFKGLYLCYIDKSVKESKITVYELEKPLSDFNKSIKNIVFVTYNSNDYEIFDFFKTVSIVLEHYCY